MQNLKLSERIEKVKAGERRALIKLLTEIPELAESNASLLWKNFLKHSKRPVITGLVGTPGAGKSTFLNTLIHHKESHYPDESIGLLLIDPANPINHGSILGDRVRLSDHYLNDKIYIRSISNLGQIDGLNPYLDFYLMAMSLFPFQHIIVETVGGGQASTNISRYVDRVVLIYDPHGGDGVQHLKGGVLDIASEIIVSKADTTNAEGVINSLKEWANPSANYWKANLTDKNTLESYFKESFFKHPKLNSKKLIQMMIFREANQKFLKHYSQFFDSYFSDDKVTEEKIQLFFPDFKKFLTKNF